MSPSLPPVQPSSRSGGHNDPHVAGLNLSGILELRINSSSVVLYPPPDTPDATSPATSICLLSGPLGDFFPYSRQEASKWLIDLAHDICDPALSRGTLLKESLHPVADTDPLTPSTYYYALPAGIMVGLSKISHRTRKSITRNASTMGEHVKRRDEVCWVTANDAPLVNSHICPKRMGDHLAQIIFTTFTSLPLIPNLSIYNEIFGLCLTRNIDAYFEAYEFGFRFVSPNNYECHVFAIAPPGKVLTEAGRASVPSRFPLHGQSARAPRPEAANVPPPGLFRWHYLQCVLKRFAHDDYKNLANIYHSELPLRMEGDSDGEDTDSESEW